MTHKKRLSILLFVLFLLIAAAGIIAAETVPIYPDFQKSAASYDELQAALVDETPLVLPQKDNPVFSEPEEYKIILDGRTALSKPSGYLITEASIYNGASIHYSLEGLMSVLETPQETEEYKDVSIGISEIESSSANTITAAFVLDGCTYTIQGYYNPSKAAAVTADIDDYLQSSLLAGCRHIIDRYNNEL